MNTEKLIQRFISNTLSEKDKALVLRLSETDEDFKAELQEHINIHEAFKAMEAKALKNQLGKLDKSKTKVTLLTKYKYLTVAVAAALILGFFYTVNTNPTGEELFNSNFDIYPNTLQPITRGDSNRDIEGFLAYENGNFEIAEIEFQKMLRKSDNPNLRFFYALSILNQKKLGVALVQFNKLNKTSFDYKEESLWYETLILIHNENRKEALLNLKKLDSLNSSFKSQERKLLLQELKDD